MEHIIKKIANRLSQIVGRCTVQIVDETSGRQRVQLAGYQGEVLDQVEVIGLYGFTSSPLPGAIAGLICGGGSRDTGIVIGHDDARYRPVNMAPGEVCMYNYIGNTFLIFQEDGSIVLSTDATAGVTINAPNGPVTISGNLQVNGNITVTGNSTIDGNETVNGEFYGGVVNTAGPLNLSTHIHGYAGGHTDGPQDA